MKLTNLNIKKALILLALIFLMNISFAQDKIPDDFKGIWKEYYANGQLRATGEYVNRVMKGEWKLYYDTGKLKAIGKYENNIPVPGTWKIYNKTGELSDCDILPPSQRLISQLSVSIYQKLSANNPREFSPLAYQEILFEMAGVNVNDGFDVIKKKIQNLWKYYGDMLIAYNYPDSAASGLNILKFSLDTGYTATLIEMCRRYKIDLNFIDPGDGKTILDFVEDRIAHVRNTPPIDVAKAEEYEHISGVLKKGGALHNYEITKSR